jgi:hypothetical protein
MVRDWVSLAKNELAKYMGYEGWYQVAAKLDLEQGGERPVREALSAAVPAVLHVTIHQFWRVVKVKSMADSFCHKGKSYNLQQLIQELGTLEVPQDVQDSHHDIICSLKGLLIHKPALATVRMD